jgi:PKD repeat protein
MRLNMERTTWMAAALVFLLMADLPSIQASGELPRMTYRDDFDHTSNWSVVEGTWRFRDGAFNGSGWGRSTVGFDARAVAGDDSWADYNFSGRFMIVAGAEADLLFRVLEADYGENNGRYMQLSNAIGGGVTLYRISDGRVSQKTAPFSFYKGIWYDFSILLGSDRVDYFLNGTPVLNQSSLDFGQGRIGLKAYKSACHFDDILVREMVTNATLFSDGFDSDPCGGWNPQKGTWSFSGGECALVSDMARNDLMLAPPSASGPSWTARVQLMWTAGTNFETGLCFGFNNTTSHYIVYLSASDQTIRILRRNGASVNASWARVAFPVQKGEWYTLTLVRDLDNLTLFVNTALVVARNDTSFLPGEGFGLASYAATQERVRFNFIEITDSARPPRPDLAVNLSALQVYPPHPNPGEDVMFIFNIDNNGSADAAGNFSVRLSCNGTPLSAIYPENVIVVGKSLQVFLHWKANLTGEVSLQLLVDADDQVNESEEGNNCATVMLHVNIPPVAEIATIPQEGAVEVEQEVIFDGNGSRDPDGNISSYLWTFGDKTAASVAFVRHRYKEAGTYTVVLNVTDNDGVSSVVSKKLTVRQRQPEANITWTPVKGNVSTLYIFRYQLYDPDHTLSAFWWDFGDQSNTTDQAPSHRYSDDGTFNVTFVMSYNLGRDQKTKSGQLVVDNTPPQAWIATAPAELKKDQPGYFSACVTDPDDIAGPPALVWSFPDGTESAGAEAWHRFNQSGVVRVTLTATDEKGLISTVFTMVRILNLPPEPSITLPPPAYVGTDFMFDAGFSRDPDGAVASFLWDFGDGAKGAGTNVHHNFSIPGNYTITLTVTDDEGLSNSTSAVLWVRSLPTAPPVPAAPAKEQLPAAAVAAALVVAVAALALVMWWRSGRKGRERTGADRDGPGGSGL